MACLPLVPLLELGQRPEFGPGCLSPTCAPPPLLLPGEGTSPPPPPSPQVGFMSREVGASLAFLLDTTRNSSGAAAKKQTGADRLMVSIGIAHLRRCGDS